MITLGGPAIEQTDPVPAGLAYIVGRLLRDTGLAMATSRIEESWRAAADEADLARLLHVLGMGGLEVEPAPRRLRRLGADDLPLVVAAGDTGQVYLVEPGGEPGVLSCVDLKTGQRQALERKALQKWAGRAGQSFSPHVATAPQDRTPAQAARERLGALNPIRNIGMTRLAWILLAAFISNVLNLATSLFVMVVYDRVLPNKAVESLYALAAGVALALVFDTLLKRAREGLVETATRNADARVTEDIFDQYVAVANRDRRMSIGALASISRDFETYRDFMSTAMILTFVDLPFVAIFIAVVWSVAGLVALVPLLALPLVLGAILLVQPIVSRASKETAQSAQSRQGLLVEILSGLDTLRVNGAYAMMKNRFLSEAARHTRAAQKSKRYHGAVGTIVAMAQQVAQVAVIVLGFHLFVAQEITMGAIIAAVILTGRVMGPVARLGQTLGRGNMALVAWRNLRDFLGTPRPEPGQTSAALSTPNRQIPAVELSNVTYRTADGAPPLFAGLNLVINPGERVAIVGRTGSGKSTLIRLINGLVAPETGSVLVNGKPVEQIPRAEIHGRIGTVFQIPWLFSGTLYDNIALGHPDMDETKVRGALAMAGLAPEEGAGGMDLALPIADQGANLSGGERQAVSLARAFAFDPPLYLLDEPSSAMDAILEGRLTEQVKGRLKGQTFVIVTHKSRMLDLCDRVIMLDRGQVVRDVPMAEYVRAMRRTTPPGADGPPKAPRRRATASNEPAFHKVPQRGQARGET